MDTESPSEKLPRKNHFESAFKRIKNLFSDRKLCDVTILCNNKQIEIHAHRVILSSVSDYFNAMFTNNLAETYKDKIEISGDGEALQIIIDFIYTGIVNKYISIIGSLRNKNYDSLIFIVYTYVNNC